MKIVPALLAEEFEEFVRRLRQAEAFAGYVQIDIMDGVFVPTRSFPPERLNAVKTASSFELHLMVNDPLAVSEQIHNPGLKKIIFHIESGAEPMRLMGRIRERGLSAGLAIKPQTATDKFREAAEYADTLLFLTVEPGNYGSPFKPEVLKKIAGARKAFQDKEIGVDGGVSLDNLKDFFDMGVDYVCIGSRIFLHGGPEENYRLFRDKLKEFQALSLNL